MKVVVYPGSFDPFHKGHREITLKATNLFDKVIIAVGRNPDKDVTGHKTANNMNYVRKAISDIPNVSVTSFERLLSDFVEELKKEGNEVVGVVRGLRNSSDFESEKTQQYWYEDTGLAVPILYLISGRENCHISSSAIRALEKFRK